MNQFPDNLRRLRERRGMNRRALSELVGISKNMVSRYERGERLPDIKTAMEIADFFKVSLDDLCGHEKNFSLPPFGGASVKNYAKIMVGGNPYPSFFFSYFFIPLWEHLLSMVSLGAGKLAPG